MRQRTLSVFEKSMDKSSTLLTAALCALLSACVHPDVGGGQSDAFASRLWRVEQDEIGKFVFCQPDDCPKRTPKTLKTVRKAEYVPPVLERKERNEVKFAFGSAQLNKSAQAKLKRLLPELREATAVQLRGWTDPVSGRNSKVNQRLSERRVSAVKTWLMKQGINRKIISTDSQPPCCNLNATAKSPDRIRSQMRIVTIEAR